MSNYFDNVLQHVYDFTLDNETNEATLHYGGNEIKCFFRRNNDATNNRDTMILYHSPFEKVKAGSLIDFRGKTFLALNDETAENNIYFKNAVVQTNGMITTFSLSAEDIPVWADNANNETLANGEMIKLIDGTLRLLTEDCEQSRKIQIGDRFNEYGRSWSISNIYFKDGLAHILAEVIEDDNPEFSYRIEFVDFETTAKPNTEVQLVCRCFRNDKLIENPTLTYSSSDNFLATIDENGKISYSENLGEVYFIVTWNGYSQITETVTIAEEPAEDEITIYMQTLSEEFYAIDVPYQLEIYACRNGVKDLTTPIRVYAENLKPADESYLKYIKVVDKTNGTYEISASNSEKLNRSDFDLVAKSDEYNVEARQSIHITPFF